jgi:phenylacetate-CoA ligase
MSARRRTPAPGRRNLSDRVLGGSVFRLWAGHEHPHYAAFRRAIEASQFWPAERLRQLQQQRLTALLTHAAARCPFYQKRFLEAGLDPAQANDADAWRRLPLLTKADIQNHGAAMQAVNFPLERRFRNQTGGSTGSPLQFYVDRERLDTRMASTHRHNAWAGHLPGDWMAELWGNRLDLAADHGVREWLRQQLLYRTLSLNTSSVSRQDWHDFVRRLRRKRPRFLLAYALAAVAFAEFVRQERLSDIRFDGIITSAEVLTAPHRAIIEDALGGPVFNRYGCREMSVIASECAAHSGLHVNSEALLVEVIPTPLLPAPWGKVVLTDLLNFSMPLIRYEVGDVSRWAEGDCPCGRSLPRLAEVQGRTTEFLQLPGGRIVSGPALTLVFADLAAVRQVQFLQRADASVQLKVVPGAGYGEGARETMRSRLNLYLKGEVPLDIVEVESIASEPSGKYLFVVRNTSGTART